MTLFSYYLTERMVEEKENKLNDFLERQGVSKKKYILSWFITYCILGALPFASFCCLYGFFMIFQYFFTFINLVLFMLSVYSVMFFFYTTMNSLKKGSIIIKLYNFISTLVGIGLSMPKTSRNLKLIFCLIPQINIYYTANVMYTISDTYEFSLELLTKQVKHICYLETFLFFVLQIVFYLSIAFFIQSYKSSGLSFCLYLKSFFSNNVSREISNEDNEALIGDDRINNILNYEIHHQTLSLIQQQKKKEKKKKKRKKRKKKIKKKKKIKIKKVNVKIQIVIMKIQMNQKK